MTRLRKLALIDLQAEDLRSKKDEKSEETQQVQDSIEEIEIQEIKEEDKPKFEQPEVTPESVDSEFGIEDVGMGIEMIPLEESLQYDVASLQVLYQQTKLFHWVFNGENYIATHRFLDEVAGAILEQIDLYTERLVFLGINPVADMSQITNLSYVEFVRVDKNFKFNVLLTTLENGLEQIINSMKDNSIRASEAKDIGTSKMLEDFVYDLEVLQHHIRSFK